MRLGLEMRGRAGNQLGRTGGGYLFEPSPAPEASGDANYLDNDRHAATFGTAISGRWLGTTLKVDVFGQLHILATRINTKMASVLPSNSGSPSLTTGGTVFFMGCSERCLCERIATPLREFGLCGFSDRHCAGRTRQPDGHVRSRLAFDRNGQRRDRRRAGLLCELLQPRWARARTPIRLEIGYMSATHALGKRSRQQVDPVHGLVAGIVAPTRIFGVPFAFGLGLHVPDDRLARRATSLAIAAAMGAVRQSRSAALFRGQPRDFAVPWLRVGGGFRTSLRRADSWDCPARSRCDERCRFRARFTRSTPTCSRCTTRSSACRSTSSGADRRAVYRGEFRFRLDIDANLDVDSSLGVSMIPTALAGGTMISLKSGQSPRFCRNKRFSVWRGTRVRTSRCAPMSRGSIGRRTKIPTAIVNASVSFEMSRARKIIRDR